MDKFDLKSDKRQKKNVGNQEFCQFNGEIIQKKISH